MKKVISIGTACVFLAGAIVALVILGNKEKTIPWNSFALDPITFEKISSKSTLDNFLGDGVREITLLVSDDVGEKLLEQEPFGAEWSKGIIKVRSLDSGDSLNIFPESFEIVNKDNIFYILKAEENIKNESSFYSYTLIVFDPDSNTVLLQEFRM